MRLYNLSLIVLSAATVMLLTGCRDGDSKKVLTGYIYDDVVSGLEYSTATQSGLTGSDGSFKYIKGEKVTFKIGNLTLGKATDANVILTLFDLASIGQNSDGTPSDEVANMAILLQSLDEDKDPNNGITISEATRNMFKTFTTQTLKSDSNITKIINVDANMTTVAIKVRAIALDHLLTTVASIKGATTLAKQTYSTGNISEITRYTVDTMGYDLTYALTSTTSKLPIGVGSSLALKSNSNGEIVFYGITDRGPNADAPEGTGAVVSSDGNFSLAKSFPLPAFVPKIAEITLKNGKAVVSKTIDLKANATTNMSGLPLPLTQTGSTGEAAMNTTLGAILGTSVNGIDPEGIAIDKDKNLWISDEYGPFIAKVDPVTGVLLQKFIPGDATNPLPTLLKNRVPNRGMEGITVDATTGLVYAIVQTPLDTDAIKDSKGDDTWLTLVELNPTTKEVNLYAVAFDAYVKTTNPTGFKADKIKVGDLTSLGNGKFLMIEQGKNDAKTLVNNIVMIDISGATKITSTMYTGVSGLKKIVGTTIVPSTRTLIANLRDFGWLAEKAEGLVMLDPQTIALINDNDFGIAADASCTVGGAKTSLDATKLKINLITNTLTTTEVTCDAGTLKYALTNNAEYERRTRLWTIKLSKPITQF